MSWPQRTTKEHRRVQQFDMPVTAVVYLIQGARGLTETGLPSSPVWNNCFYYPKHMAMEGRGTRCLTLRQDVVINENSRLSPSGSSICTMTNNSYMPLSVSNIWYDKTNLLERLHEQLTETNTRTINCSPGDL